ncbi:MAG: T9SS type A sorting domain-containing protein [Bacteroidetes bacterium]|nr:T9SS type A sorting domain-containing protein [Bacteroidota bacterium]
MKKALIILMLIGLKSFAQPTLQTVYETTNSQINLYIVSQGFTSSSMSNFDNYVTGFLNFMWSQEPYASMQNRFRVITVKEAATTENVPGATFLFNNLTEDQIHNFVCVPDTNPSYRQYESGECLDDFYTRMDNLIPYLTGYNSRSYVIAVFNNNYYTGRGGKYAFVTTFCNQPFMYKVLLHEFGHTFGLLADEYGFSNTLPYQQDEFCNIIYDGGVPQYISPNDYPLFHDRNVTSRTTNLPWEYLLSGSYPVCDYPGTGTDCSNTMDIGRFEGANYVNSGWYRPRNSCGMQSLSVSPFSFCQVCIDLIKERIQEHLCDATNNVTENFVSRHQYITHWRKASNLLTSNSTIGNKISVNYVSGNGITLTNGFKAESGSDFRAYIDDCSLIPVQNTYRKAEVNSLSGLSSTKENQKVKDAGSSIIVSPNPVSTLLHVKVDRDKIVKTQLWNSSGKLLLDESIAPQEQIKLDLSAYQKGTYILSATTEKGKCLSKKIIKN